MNRSEFNAHQGLKEGLQSAECREAQALAQTREALAQARATLKHRAQVKLLQALLVANAVIWTAQHVRGVL